MADETPTPEQTEQVLTYTAALEALAEAQSDYEARTISATNALLAQTNDITTLNNELSSYATTLREATEETVDFTTSLGVAGAALGTLSLGKILAENIGTQFTF